MKIDAHHHLWRYNTDDYTWIDDEMEVLKKDFLPSDIQKELGDAGFNGSIVVQARQTLEETDWLLELASENSFIKGVVGWVDLCSANIEKQLEKYVPNSKLVGVRHVIHDEPDDNFMNRSDFQNGIGHLAKFGLTYDLLVFPKHLPLTKELVAKFPEQHFVLDHIAKPLIKKQIKEPWASDILELAQMPNVYCKLSGMVTEADWKNWTPSDFEYYLDVVFNAFGTDRIMIGSDWPVCTLAGKYDQVMSIVKNYIKKFDITTQHKVLGTNCSNFYLTN